VRVGVSPDTGPRTQESGPTVSLAWPDPHGLLRPVTQWHTSRGATTVTWLAWLGA